MFTRALFHKLFYSFLVLYSCSLFATQWDWTMNMANGTFSGTDVVTGTTMSGTFSQMASGFYQMTVANSTGSLAVAPGSQFKFLYSSDFGAFTPPLISGETGISAGFAKGACPQIPKNVNWVGMNAPALPEPDMRDSRIATFGKATWDSGLGQLTFYGYRISDFMNVMSNGGAMGTQNGTCQNGIISMKSLSGASTGSLWVSVGDAFTFYSLGGQVFVGFAPQALSAMSVLSGNYVGLIQDRSRGTGVEYVSATADSNGNFTINRVNPATGVLDTSVTDTTSFQTMNSPYSGQIGGTITRNNASGNIECGTHQVSPLTVYCIAQSPESNSYSYAITLVKNVPAGNGNGSGGSGNGGTPPGQGGTPPGQAKK